MRPPSELDEKCCHRGLSIIHSFLFFSLQNPLTSAHLWKLFHLPTCWGLVQTLFGICEMSSLVMYRLFLKLMKCSQEPVPALTGWGRLDRWFHLVSLYHLTFCLIPSFAAPPPLSNTYYQQFWLVLASSWLWPILFIETWNQVSKQRVSCLIFLTCWCTYCLLCLVP